MLTTSKGEEKGIHLLGKNDKTLLKPFSLPCMGDNVFLGWSDKTKSKFDELAKNFQK